MEFCSLGSYCCDSFPYFICFLPTKVIFKLLSDSPEQCSPDYQCYKQVFYSTGKHMGRWQIATITGLVMLCQILPKENGQLVVSDIFLDQLYLKQHCLWAWTSKPGIANNGSRTLSCGSPVSWKPVVMCLWVCMAPMSAKMMHSPFWASPLGSPTTLWSFLLCLDVMNGQGSCLEDREGFG